MSIIREFLLRLLLRKEVNVMAVVYATCREGSEDRSGSQPHQEQVERILVALEVEV